MQYQGKPYEPQHGDRITMSFHELANDVPVIHEVIRAGATREVTVNGTKYFVVPTQQQAPQPQARQSGKSVWPRGYVAAQIARINAESENK